MKILEFPREEIMDERVEAVRASCRGLEKELARGVQIAVSQCSPEERRQLADQLLSVQLKVLTAIYTLLAHV